MADGSLSPQSAGVRLRPRQAPTVLSLIAISAMLWLLGARDGVPGEHEVLRADAPTIAGVLFHQLHHAQGFHFLASALVLFLAGGVLEGVWGSRRFLAFLAVCAGSVAIVDLVAARISLGALGPEEPVPWVLGLGGLALACLVAVAVEWPHGRIAPSLPVPATVWSLVFLASAGLMLLEASSPRGPGLLLAPQLSGVGVSILWFWVAARRAGAYRVASGVSAASSADPADPESADSLRSRVDALLDKISEVGYDGLSRREKTFLRQASRHYRYEGGESRAS